VSATEWQIRQLDQGPPLRKAELAQFRCDVRMAVTARNLAHRVILPAIAHAGRELMSRMPEFCQEGWR
jgi:hypothetical protein